jgi:AraC-like DNA-binding protein
MTFYQHEIERIRQACYANTRQLNTVIGIRHYINQHLDQDISLDRLSQLRYTSKFHLLRLFKRYYGQTPQQYLTGKRIEKAKELLGLGLSVTETCFDVGLESPSSFCTLFKSRVGLTPTEFQKRATFTKPV